MRAGIIGLLLGVALAVVMLFLAQRQLAREAAPDLKYDFTHYIFSEAEFPFGDLEQGRALRRAFFPMKITVRFFDAQYREVTRADRPGRYGAVVRIALNGAVEYRYLTLYRTPVPVFWADGPMTASAELPPGCGIDPAVLRNQAAQIGDTIKKGTRHDLEAGLAILLAGLSETSPTDPPANRRSNFAARDDAWWFGLRRQLGLVPYYPYLADLPRDYAADSSRHWPLLLYLHGMGERGEDLRIVRHSGLARAVAEGRQIPAIVISPQMPNFQDWNLPALAQLLDDVSAKYRVDRDRVYLVGTSSGGDAAWKFALAYPDRVAAIVSMAGETRNDDFGRIRTLPAWVFDGAKDRAVDPVAAQSVPQELERAGGHAHLTIYPDLAHDCWDRALATDAVYTWLLAQKRGQPEVIPAGVTF